MVGCGGGDNKLHAVVSNYYANGEDHRTTRILLQHIPV